MITKFDYLDHLQKMGEVEIADSAIIEVSESLEIGSGSKIREFCIIKGRNVKIGKNFVMNHHSEIGGGSCFEKESSLEIGDNCHLGSYAIINTARAVKIGQEVGMGRFTNLYTHGAWLNPLEGFPDTYGPITIGNKVWIPSATILPNTDIGNNVVISEGAKVQGIVESGMHVTRSGKQIRKYPADLPLDDKNQIIKEILKNYKNTFIFGYPIIKVNGATFDVESMVAEGKSSKESEALRTLLRRHGMRFTWKGLDEK